MMSPLAVSQYLPSTLRFDAVIFDEASQVRPSDAVNCIYRGDQLIVAGDQKQLPPSAFFERVAGGGDDDTYDDEQLDEFESVLDAAKASSFTSLPLRWHYRSRHESLISYSNYRFYGGRLHTFPSPAITAPDLGIELFKVNGTYRRGGARDNPDEARAVIDRVLFHRRNHPDLTLGVVAFSVAQEEAIVRQLEEASSVHRELESLLSDDRLHGFFVKNLENVQGDERDIIVFSIGYGPDETGRFHLNLGPINKPGGWRRLYVAITRAKRRVDVVTSVLPEDFTGDLRNPGVRHLRGYLDFARRGIEALAVDIGPGGGDTESPFEEEVLRFITSLGYSAIPQVGVAGFRIDLGVRDPADPSRYVIGIECDGAMYHSSRVARDRDRLREEVIRGLGWQLHRIWSMSWFYNRAEQERRLVAAIEAAIAGVANTTPPAAPPLERDVTVEHIDFNAPPEWATPYEVASPTPPYYAFEMHDRSGRPDLRRMMQEVLAVEAPVHEERVLRVVREAWGVARAGHRIKAAFDEVGDELESRGRLVKDEGIWWRGDQDTFFIRTPTEDPSTLRPVAHVPAEELRAAAYRLTRDAGAITPDDLRIAVARFFGWSRNGTDITAAIDAAIDDLVDDGRVSGTEVLTANGASS
jgi:REase_MTES_1575/Protein of unknown function (DUF3320)/AAA domain